MYSDLTSLNSGLAGPLLPVNMTVCTPEIEQLCLDVASSTGARRVRVRPHATENTLLRLFRRRG